MLRISVYAIATLALVQSAFSQETTVRLGLDWGYLPYHAPLVIGMQEGYFKNEGIDLKFEPGRGSATTAIMLGQGNYDIAHINITNAAVAISKGVPIKAVAVYQTKTAASFIGIEGKVKLDSADSIKRYSIGSTPGGSDQLSLRIYRAVNKIGERDLNVVSLDANAKQAALLAGSVDIISGDGFAYAAIVRGTGQKPTLFLLADHGVPLLGFGYSVSKSFAAKNPQAVKGFLRAMKKSWQAAVADIPAACRKARAELNLTHSQSACEDYIGGLIDLSVSPSDANWGRQTEDMWTKLLGTLTQVGEVPAGYAIGDYYTNEYVPQ